MKVFAEELFTEKDECNGKRRVSEEDTFFADGAELFYGSMKNGFFPCFRGEYDKNQNLMCRPRGIKCEDGKPLRGLNLLLVQQQAELFDFPVSLDGNSYIGLDPAGQIHLSSSGNFGKCYNYRFSPMQNSFVPSADSRIGQRVSFIIPDDFTASEYLGKWIAASRVGGVFVTSDEKNRKASRIILRELLKGKEEDFVRNAFQLGYDAEMESTRVLKSAVEKVGNAIGREVRYSEKEAEFAFA